MSIESLRAAREASDAALQFQQGQGQNAKSVNQELGQKANQAAASKDAKARQLVQARYDLRVASADEELAKKEAERKQRGMAFAAINVFSTLGLSMLDRYINNDSSELGNTEKPDEKAWKDREASKYVDAEKAKGREIVGGANGVRFEEIDGQPGKLKVSYDVADIKPADPTPSSGDAQVANPAAPITGTMEPPPPMREATLIVESQSKMLQFDIPFVGRFKGEALKGHPEWKKDKSAQEHFEKNVKIKRTGDNTATFEYTPPGATKPVTGTLGPIDFQKEFGPKIKEQVAKQYGPGAVVDEIRWSTTNPSKMFADVSFKYEGDAGKKAVAEHLAAEGITVDPKDIQVEVKAIGPGKVGLSYKAPGAKGSGYDPEKATRAALAEKYGVKPEEIKLEPAEGGKFKYTVTPAAKAEAVAAPEAPKKPAKTEKVTLTVDKVDIKADPGKSGAWHATNKWVLTPIFGSIADTYDSLKVMMQAKDKADQAVDKHKNAIQKREAAKKKLQELEATLESF